MKITLALLLLGVIAIPLTKPATASPKELHILFYDPLHSTDHLKDALAAVDRYDVGAFGNRIDKNALLITTIFDDQVSRHLQSGGRAIILCDSINTFPEGAPFKVKARDPIRDSWIKIDSGPFANLKDREEDKQQYDAVEPEFVITNLRGEINDDVFARVNRTENGSGPIIAMQMYAAGGSVFVTTFRLQTYDDNKWAARLLDAIIDYTMSPNFSPKYDWHIREE